MAIIVIYLIKVDKHCFGGVINKLCVMQKNNEMGESISFLLGAGFSAPKGYPVGNSLNDKLLKLTNEWISFSPDGRLTVSTDGTKPNFGYKTSYDIEFEFCLVLIKYYNSNVKCFDYEEFYDYLLGEAFADKEAERLATIYYLNSSDYSQLIAAMVNIYNQLISYHIKDSDNNKWYDNQPYLTGCCYPGYTGLFQYLKHINDESIVNVHTLNHDLFFESLNSTDFFSGQICDGFEELGSPYYGQLEKENRCYKCRLQYYTGNYNSKYRLFKLHGSLDYGIYSSSENGVFTPENYLKTRCNIGFSNLYKEISKDGHIEYENCWINYHSDFLTGTTSKIERYKEPILYKKMFELFQKNLNMADKLIIIGYGAKDSKINEMIEKNYDFTNKPSFIIDPYAGESVIKFSENINSKLINKHLENIVEEDFL